MIRIVNLRNYTPRNGEILVKVDRSNRILGNQFVMKEESERDLVCDKYDAWFNRMIELDDNLVKAELWRIGKMAEKNDIALGCWCYPKRCHSNTIKRYLEG